MATSRAAAVATAEPVSEAEVPVPPNEPLQLTFDLYDNFLNCPRCGGRHLHHNQVTVYDRNEDAPRVTKIEVRDGSALVTRADSCASANPSDRRNGVAIEFWCEDCDRHSELCVTQHKGGSFVGWRASEPGHRSCGGSR
jgi:hypothetical protein